MICLADVNILNSALNSCGLLDRIWTNMLGNGESESGYQLFVKRFGGHAAHLRLRLHSCQVRGILTYTGLEALYPLPLSGLLLSVMPIRERLNHVCYAQGT
jgi:hypothetical protein